MDPAATHCRPADGLAPSTHVVETHLSRIFLTPDRAYKQLKAVTTSFVDLADPDDRLVAATREFELNQRLSPDVYLGTADVDEGGTIVERLIVMRRLPADRQLDRLISDSDPDIDDHIRRVARLMATLHSAQPPEHGDTARGATLAALRANWDDSFATVEPLVGTVIPASEHQLARDLVDRYLNGRGALFEERIEQGWVRDGHGDLRAEHVFCLDDGPRLIDCLAFRDDLRITDVLLDLAFLVMDLHRLVGPGPALSLVRHYDEFAGERHPSTLAHHYVAYRAHLRAKIAAIRYGQGVAEAAQEVADYHELALQHLLVGQPRLVLVGGGAGVGKSTVAAGVADAIGAVWLRADELRKNLAGLPADEHAFEQPDEGIYRPEFSDRVYRELVREAEVLLARGESVVLDATWSAEHRRVWARELAEATSSTLSEIHCQVPLAVARERIARRLASIDDPSDASPEIADHLAATFEPWPTAIAVDTGLAIARSVEAACDVVVDRHRRRSRAEPAHLEELILSRETIEFFLHRISAWERRLAAVPWPGPTGRPL